MSLSFEPERIRDDSVPPDVLCQCCKDFVARVDWHLHQPATPVTYRHYESGIELLIGAGDRCHICSILANDHDTSDLMELGSIVAHVKQSENTWTTVCSITWTPSEDLSAPIYTTDVLNGIRSRRPHHPSAIRASTFSTDAIALISSWIEPHLLIPQTTSREVKYQIPRRVLDLIGDRPGDYVKVVSGEALRKADYVTLSYAWGDTRPAWQSLDMDSQQHDTFLTSQLPKTFQHAIWLTRQLKLRYLWIDALCMGNQDTEEWFAESRKMDGIYYSSLFTIVAADAQNCAAGFLRPRNPLGHLECHFKDKNDRTLIIAPPCYPEAGLESHLDKRGWNFQERILSTRSVHFNNTRIYLEELVSPMKTSGIITEITYRSHILCEHHYQKPCKSSDTGTRAIMDRALGFRGLAFDTDYAWWEIISRYSTTQLTRESDRLVAMAGLVARMQVFMNRPYTFGHWRNYVPQGLSWMAAQPGVRALKRAPSWSWASISGSKIIRPKLHNAESILKGILHREARLSTNGLPGMSDNTGVAPLTPTDELYSVKIRAPLATGTLVSHGTQIRLKGHLEESLLEFHQDYYHPDLVAGVEVVCALICTGREQPNRIKQVEYIILRKHLGRKNLYSRIGFAAQTDIQDKYHLALDYLRGLEVTDIIII